MCIEVGGKQITGMGEDESIEFIVIKQASAFLTINYFLVAHLQRLKCMLKTRNP